MTWHIFKEPRKGYVAHTGPSEALAEIPLLGEWVGMICEEMWPSAAQVKHRFPNSNHMY